MDQLKKVINFKESPASGAYEIFHKIAENFIFFRWVYFKNRPRTTFLLIRSCLITGLLFNTYYTLFSHFRFILMGIDIHPVLFFATMAIIGYWKMCDSFYEKSNYCSNLYNEIYREIGHGNWDSSRILSINFSGQLLTLDLWGHRIYSKIFIETLNDAIFWASTQGGNEDYLRGKQIEDFIELANKGELAINEVRNLLEAYKEHYRQKLENSSSVLPFNQAA